MCVLKPCLHRSIYYLILYCLPYSLISHPPCIWFCYFHPRLTPPEFSFLLYPLLDGCYVFFCGALQVSSRTFFLKQKEETFQSYQKALWSWWRSSWANSQMMTAIVKGQISPCGFASDCMFISFWSSRDSKPLSCSPHSPNSWSSACHWNRLIADPGDRGKEAVCHPTSVLAKKFSCFTFISFQWD